VEIMKYAKTFIAISTMLLAFAAVHADEDKVQEAVAQEQATSAEAQVAEATKGCGCGSNHIADAVEAVNEL
jgi:hypothetical protein